MLDVAFQTILDGQSASCFQKWLFGDQVWTIEILPKTSRGLHPPFESKGGFAPPRGGPCRTMCVFVQCVYVCVCEKF